MKRRDFIKNSALVTAALGVAPSAVANEAMNRQSETPEAKKPLIDSCPVLQNYSATSIGVAFGVTDLANGYVIYGQKADLSDGKKVLCGGFRQTDVNDKVMLVRITDLTPDTTYYYKIGADRIHYGGGYDIKVVETVTDDKIYSFHTAGEATPCHFCVINDTHASWDVFAKVQQKINDLNPHCVVWNGDACNSDETIDELKEIFLNQPTPYKDFAANRPYLFTFGNHEGRSFDGRHLEKIWMTRQPEERSSRFWDLGRNFAIRMGDVAMIGLDTGEDKVDTNPKFAGLFLCKPYREAQAEWLREALQQPEIASAPFLIAVCHIPLFDHDPKSNPGDIYPDDSDSRYTTDFALWQRTCYQLWSPLLESAGCQLVITAHNHRYRFDKPCAEHRWAQVVGGGCTLDEGTKDYPTVIEGKTEKGRFVLNVFNILTGKREAQHVFNKRK